MKKIWGSYNSHKPKFTIIIQKLAVVLYLLFIGVQNNGITIGALP